jgi:DNA helicase HerA-like ATPase
MNTSSLYLGTAATGVVELPLSRANRHGLIAGATGTGKTVSLHALAEQLARAGCCVLATDVKGDLAGISQPGDGAGWITKRYIEANLPYTPAANAVVPWDVFGKHGHPIRLTLSDLGPALLARLLSLNETQTGVLQVAFQCADDEGLLLLDLDDLRALLSFVSANAKAVSAKYGNVAPATLATIQRALLTLQQEGLDAVFGEPSLQVADLLQRAPNGRGTIHLLDATTLINQPRAYATVLLYVLSELFEQLPEVGDLPVPKLALLFDEAHLLFDEAPKPLLEKIEQVVRLIRSKGVGVYFCTQQPSDVPDSVLAQLGNRIQHALRAATPQGKKDITIAARTMAPNPAFKTEDALPQLAVGEALVSVLDGKGIPTPVQSTAMLPPASRVGPISAAERTALIHQSPFQMKYAQAQNRESAAEILAARMEKMASDSGHLAPKGGAQPTKAEGSLLGGMAKDMLLGSGRRQGLLETAAKQVVRTAASQAGRALLRGVLGSLLKR